MPRLLTVTTRTRSHSVGQLRALLILVLIRPFALFYRARDARWSIYSGVPLQIGLLHQLQRAAHFNIEIMHGAFKRGGAKQYLHGLEIDIFRY